MILVLQVRLAIGTLLVTFHRSSLMVSLRSGGKLQSVPSEYVKAVSRASGNPTAFALTYSLGMDIIALTDLIESCAVFKTEPSAYRSQGFKVLR